MSLQFDTAILYSRTPSFIKIAAITVGIGVITLVYSRIFRKALQGHKEPTQSPPNKLLFPISEITSPPSDKLSLISKKFLKIVIHENGILKWNFDTHPSPIFTNDAFVETANGDQIPLHVYCRSFIPRDFVAKKPTGDPLDAENLEIVVQTFVGNRNLSDQLSASFKHRLLQFLKTGRNNNQKYCCVDFMQELYGHSQKHLHDFNPTEWEISPFELIASLRREESVFLYDKGGKIIHCACYLGRGFFISLLGNGPLVISSLITLEIHYKSTRVARCRLIA